MKNTVPLSGLQNRLWTSPSSYCVSERGAFAEPLSRSTTQTFCTPARSQRNATRFPLGDHVASDGCRISRRAPIVSGRDTVRTLAVLIHPKITQLASAATATIDGLRRPAARITGVPARGLLIARPESRRRGLHHSERSEEHTSELQSRRD